MAEVTLEYVSLQLTRIIAIQAAHTRAFEEIRQDLGMLQAAVNDRRAKVHRWRSHRDPQ